MDNIDLTELYKKPCPKFGHDMLKYFGFDPEYINLNHGSYGSTPLPVLYALNKITLLVERNPDHFHRLGFQPLLLDVRQRLAPMIGADTDEVVLVQNASMGINTILRNFEWENGDTLIVFNTAYGSIHKTVTSIGDFLPNPTIAQFVVNFPTTHAAIVAAFRDYLAALPVVKGKKVVAVIDSIVSNPGVLLPWKELVIICREFGVWSVIDGAHSIGQEPNINLSEAKPDFWVSNCHKWLSTKRTCAVMYIPKRNQAMFKTSIPTSPYYITPSKRKESNFALQYEWNGTIDYAPYLSVAAALDFRNWLGGEAKINAYCHDIALRGGKRLAEVMGTQLLDPAGDMTLNMVNVELPFPGHIKPTIEIDLKFKRKLLEGRKIYSAHFYHNNRWWTRCSGQVWSEVEDFEKLGQAWLAVCAEVIQEIGIEQ